MIWSKRIPNHIKRSGVTRTIPSRRRSAYIVKQSFMGFNCATIHFYKEEEEEASLIFNIGNHILHQFTKLIVFLRDSFLKCIGRMSLKHILSVSKTPEDYILKLFDFLVASAHSCSAKAIMEKQH